MIQLLDFCYITNAGWRDNDAPFRSTNYRVQTEDQNNELVSNTGTDKSSSALGLLALNYGNSSDSEDDPIQEDHTVDDKEINCTNCSSETPVQNWQGDAAGIYGGLLPEHDTRHQNASQNSGLFTGNGHNRDTIKNNIHQNFGHSDDLGVINNASSKLNGLVGKFSDSTKVSNTCSPDTYDAEATKFCKSITPMKNDNMPFVPTCDEDSSRMHVFCLEHAIEVEQQFREIGGVHIQLLCHPGVLSCYWYYFKSDGHFSVYFPVHLLSLSNENLSLVLKHEKKLLMWTNGNIRIIGSR